MISGHPISGAPISGSMSLAAGTVILTLIDQLLEDQTIERIYLLEVDMSSGDAIEDHIVHAFGADDVISIVPTIKLSTNGFSSDTEGVNDQVFLPLLNSPLNFKSKLYVSKDFNGQSSQGAGDITILNGDGSLDDFLEEQWDSGTVTVKVGAAGYKYTDFEVIFKGVADGITWDEDRINVRIRDRGKIFDRAIQQDHYTGIGGCTACLNLIGKPRPLCFGKVFNISPPLVDVNNQVYQVHNGSIEAIDAVYFSGLQATEGVDYTVDLSTGTFTLLVNPNGTVTCDVRGDNSGTGYISTVADIIERIATDFGNISVDDLDLVSFANINSLNSSDVGIWTGTTDVNIKSVLDFLLESVGGWWRFTRLDKLQLGIFRESSNTVLGIDETDIIKIRRVSTPLHSWRSSINYAKNWTILNRDRLAGAVTDDAANFFGEEYRSVITPTFGEVTENLLSSERYITSLLISYDSALAEVNRQQDLFGTSGRSIYEVTLGGLLFNDVIGSGIFLSYPRFGLDAGRNFVVIGSSENAGANNQILTLWG